MPCSISIFLNDNKNYKYYIDFTVEDRVEIRHLQVVAVGVGTSIETIPCMEGEVDLGVVLTKQIVQKKFHLTNKGVRVHKILVARKENIRSIKDYEEIP